MTDANKNPGIAGRGFVNRTWEWVQRQFYRLPFAAQCAAMLALYVVAFMVAFIGAGWLAGASRVMGWTP